MKQNNHFEKLRFRQSVTLSKRIYDMMDGGKKIFFRKELLRHCLFFSEFRAQLCFHTMMYRV